MKDRPCSTRESVQNCYIAYNYIQRLKPNQVKHSLWHTLIHSGKLPGQIWTFMEHMTSGAPNDRNHGVLLRLHVSEYETWTLYS